MLSVSSAVKAHRLPDQPHHRTHTQRTISVWVAKPPPAPDVCSALDQVSPACDPWSFATLRPPPAPSLLGRIPSVVVTVVASLYVTDPVGPYRCVMEQGRALRGGVPRGKPFEGVEQDVVGERHLIRREVAFEHTSVGAKLLNAVGHERCYRRGQLVRADRCNGLQSKPAGTAISAFSGPH